MPNLGLLHIKSLFSSEKKNGDGKMQGRGEKKCTGECKFGPGGEKKRWKKKIFGKKMRKSGGVKPRGGIEEQLWKRGFLIRTFRNFFIKRDQYAKRKDEGRNGRRISPRSFSSAKNI